MGDIQKKVPARCIVNYRFDSMEYEDMTAKQMFTKLKSRLAENEKTYFFLDEVQEIKGWEKVVNSLASDYNVDIYVTGSNSRMMSLEISTYLTGRYVTFRIYTLSFKEYLDFKSKHTALGDPKAELAEYIRLGGFPTTHLQSYTQDSVAASLENVVYLELLRRGYTVYVGKAGNGEIDFVASRQNDRIYVQVTQEILLSDEF